MKEEDAEEIILYTWAGPSVKNVSEGYRKVQMNQKELMSIKRVKRQLIYPALKAFGANPHADEGRQLPRAWAFLHNIWFPSQEDGAKNRHS
jgi:hypothetical protein